MNLIHYLDIHIDFIKPDIKFDKNWEMEGRNSMMAKIIGILLMGLLLTTSIALADTYEVDPVHSNVGFSVRHMVISKVIGNFTEFSGTIVFDEKNLTGSSIRGAIKTASINTENEKRDGHLKSADFFDAANHPEINFESRKVEKRSDGYVAIGRLTMKGVTKEIEIPFNIVGIVKNPMGKTVMGLEGHLKINRQDYGISWSKTLDNGGLMVSDEVEIELNAEAVKKEG